MTRHRSTPTQYEHPATYAAMVEAEKCAHAHRLAELKAASKAIVTIEPELAALKARNIYYAVGKYSMYMTSWSISDDHRSKKVLRINFGVFNEAHAEKSVSVFLERGWIVEDAKINGRCSQVLLRRPKSQVRVAIECSAEFATQRSAKPATEAA